jgi:osmotically-inducible protein OsmY
MSIMTEHRTDSEIRAGVEDELEWTPDVAATSIGVAVDEGVVSLSGEVPSWGERRRAVRAALRVRGVSTVVDKLVAHPVGSSTVTSADVAERVQRALAWAESVPDSVHAVIDDHGVVLSGEVEWNFQRDAARRAVQSLRGVKVVRNTITLTERASAPDTEERIRRALRRNALVDGDAVAVTANGSSVTLSGNVHSWFERQQAEFTAWASPHVSSVDNRIRVRSLWAA